MGNLPKAIQICDDIIKLAEASKKADTSLFLNEDDLKSKKLIALNPMDVNDTESQARLQKERLEPFLAAGEGRDGGSAFGAIGQCPDQRYADDGFTTCVDAFGRDGAAGQCSRCRQRTGKQLRQRTCHAVSLAKSGCCFGCWRTGCLQGLFKRWAKLIPWMEIVIPRTYAYASRRASARSMKAKACALMVSCLTATQCGTPDFFIASVSWETLAKTTLGTKRAG